jgi:hypothetical protein
MEASRNNRSRILFSLFVLLITGATNLHAQWSDTISKILHGKIFPTAGFDSRNSFISSNRAHIWGIKVGVDFSGRLQGGIGYNRHDKNLQKDIYFTNETGVRDSTFARLHLSYFSFYIRYVYYKTKRWKFSIMPYQLGFGNSRYRYEYNGRELVAGKRFVVLYEPGISVSYKIFQWLGVGADIGYRFMLRDNPAIPENFNSPTYAFNVQIYWGELFKMAFPESKWGKK